MMEKKNEQVKVALWESGTVVLDDRPYSIDLSKWSVIGEVCRKRLSDGRYNYIIRVYRHSDGRHIVQAYAIVSDGSDLIVGSLCKSDSELTQHINLCCANAGLPTSMLHQAIMCLPVAKLD